MIVPGTGTAARVGAQVFDIPSLYHLIRDNGINGIAEAMDRHARIHRVAIAIGPTLQLPSVMERGSMPTREHDNAVSFLIRKLEVGSQFEWDPPDMLDLVILEATFEKYLRAMLTREPFRIWDNFEVNGEYSEENVRLAVKHARAFDRAFYLEVRVAATTNTLGQGTLAQNTVAALFMMLKGMMMRRRYGNFCTATCNMLMRRSSDRTFFALSTLELVVQDPEGCGHVLVDIGEFRVLLNEMNNWGDSMYRERFRAVLDRAERY